ncbi:DUF6944 family repetitive protein [Aquibacillus albus]|uniref:RNA-binding protein YlqC (UPF0109 family) n=1 Tax=Aquibacillus albus TaxID=1168171 RepID=A0ABS2N0G3_9BACI|nr:hypothetical protein [Aquibacillus albus]MBM7571648.1 putative RNA-binding protein YlqC (UPF0109 family) [Aquibacillus albus]
MNNDQKAVLGSWIQAIGTIISAIGSTPFKIPAKLLNDLDLIGNVLQGSGNALMADSIKPFTLNKIGNQIQAIGNTTIVTQYIINFNDKTAQELEIKGDLFQAVGGGIAFSTQNWEEKPSMEEIYSTYGNLLQVIGNSMQSIAGGIEQKGGDGQVMNTVGSWIQAIGAVLSAIGQN